MRKIQRIAIRPLEGGWMMQAAELDAPMVFASGARAEAAARLLAERLSEAGEQCEIVVELRDGTTVSKFVTGPG